MRIVAKVSFAAGLALCMSLSSCCAMLDWLDCEGEDAGPADASLPAQDTTSQEGPPQKESDDGDDDPALRGDAPAVVAGVTYSLSGAILIDLSIENTDATKRLEQVVVHSGNHASGSPPPTTTNRPQSGTHVGTQPIQMSSNTGTFRYAWLTRNVAVDSSAPRTWVFVEVWYTQNGTRRVQDYVAAWDAQALDSTQTQPQRVSPTLVLAETGVPH